MRARGQPRGRSRWRASVRPDIMAVMKKAPLLILFITVFLDLLGFGIVLPLLPYYAVDFGADAFAVGGLLAIYSLAQLIFSPLWGRLSDRVGRRPVILLSLVGSSIGLTVFGLANTLWLLFASRLFSGITAATISVAQAYIADSTTAENRAKGMGIIGAAFGLGFVFGPAIGGLLAQFGHGVPAFAAAGLALANAVFAYFKLPESLPPEQRGQVVPRGFSLKRLAAGMAIPNMAPLMVLYFFTIFAFATMEATFPLLTQDRLGFTEVENGYVFAYIGVLIVILQGGLVGRLAKRFGERSLIVAGALCLAVSLALLPFAPTVGMLLLVLVPLAVGNGLTNPSLTSLISQTAESSAQGETLGLAQSLAALGRVLGPLWGGFAYAYMGQELSYVIAGVIMLAMFGLAFTIRQPAKAEPGGAAP
ncbi:MAG: MFS transporter [Candidatus Sericytochromatia bacterium]